MKKYFHLWDRLLIKNLLINICYSKEWQNVKVLKKLCAENNLNEAKRDTMSLLQFTLQSPGIINHTFFKAKFLDQTIPLFLIPILKRQLKLPIVQSMVWPLLYLLKTTQFMKNVSTKLMLVL